MAYPPIPEAGIAVAGQFFNRLPAACALGRTEHCTCGVLEIGTAIAARSVRIMVSRTGGQDASGYRYDPRDSRDPDDEAHDTRPFSKSVKSSNTIYTRQ
jgi:hypothetical protein